MPSTFDYTDYKKFLSAVITFFAEVRGYKTQLAKAAGCQKSFFSHVICSHVHLTPDHAAGLVSFWGLDEYQGEYFLTLVEMARAGSSTLRSLLKNRLIRLAREDRDIAQRLKTQKVKSLEDEMTYYSSWNWAAVHISTSIDKLQTPKAISERLQLPIGLVLEILSQLESMKLVARHADKWKITDKSIHLNSESRMTAVNHLNWRLRAIADVQKSSQDSIHYSSVFTMSLTDASALREAILNFVISTRKRIEPSESEEIFCFATDFFPI